MPRNDGSSKGDLNLLPGIRGPSSKGGLHTVRTSSWTPVILRHAWIALDLCPHALLTDACRTFGTNWASFPHLVENMTRKHLRA